MTIEAIHLVVSRVNCFDVHHCRWLFWLSLSAESGVSQYKVDFVNQCVIFFLIFFCIRELLRILVSMCSNLCLQIAFLV
jgi:hypothetical protein